MKVHRDNVVRTKIGERPRTSHHWHGFSSRGWAEKLAAFIKVIQGTIDFYGSCVSNDVENVMVHVDAGNGFLRRLMAPHANANAV